MNDKHAIYRRSGLGDRIGWGERPAVLVVDLQIGFTAPEISPVAGDLGTVVEATNRILAAARPSGAPAIFTVIAYDPAFHDDAGLWPKKGRHLPMLALGSDLVKLDPRLDHREGDPVLVKKYASAFFGTHLAPMLTAKRIDTLVVTGCTTSGCVRASVVDALGHGFRPIVPLDAVGDRAEEPHHASLFDIDSKYGDVVTTDEIVEHLTATRRHGPHRPQGAPSR